MPTNVTTIGGVPIIAGMTVVVEAEMPSFYGHRIHVGDAFEIIEVDTMGRMLINNPLCNSVHPICQVNRNRGGCGMWRADGNGFGIPFIGPRCNHVCFPYCTCAAANGVRDDNA